MHVGSMWVDRALRGRGLGIQLMAAAEEYARSKGCVASFLQTGSFEARPLFGKLGYRVYAALNDHPIKDHDPFHMSQWNAKPNSLRPSPDAGITFEPYASK